MPENLTGWMIKVWAMGHGTKVGSGEAETVTRKNLIVRLQAPRFFVQKDEVVLSANVHNYLKTDKEVTVELEIPGNVLAATGPLSQKVTVKAGAEQAGDDLGIDLRYNSSPDPGEQSTLIDNAVADGTGGLVISMANPDALKEAIGKAVSAGIPVIPPNR